MLPLWMDAQKVGSMQEAELRVMTFLCRNALQYFSGMLKTFIFPQNSKSFCCGVENFHLGRKGSLQDLNQCLF